MHTYIYIPHSIVEETKKKSPVQGKHSLEPLRSFTKLNDVPLAMLEDTDIVNDAEVHTEKADLWQCIEGEAVFTIGGEMVSPWFKKNTDGTEDKTEIFAKEIAGGDEQVIKKGDCLWIPAGVPHTHRAEGTARFFVIKVPKV
ncbi:MAG: hypothetical protein HYT37_02800 [Candidatus Sungbacteria bacterium]|nr:hypothetical protein [Candidatus Sungbacteria bacterium]